MSVALWRSAAFLDEARAWVDLSVRVRGHRLTGEWEQRCRPWSSTVRFESTGGRVWFKANGIGTRFEGPLLSALDELAPGLGPVPLAVDASRGWSLCRDAGAELRTAVGPEERWPRWEAVLSRYAEAQLALVPHGDAVRATGLREVSPANLPALARRLCEELVARPVLQGGLTDEQAALLRARLPQLGAWCDRLADCGLPDTVQHDDLHAANVCVLDEDAVARIIDWGDATYGSPLGTLLVTLGSVAHEAGIRDREDPRLLRLRDAYLDPLTAFASRRALVSCVEAARRTGCVTRALAYRAALAGEPWQVHEEHDFPVRGWLLELVVT